MLETQSLQKKADFFCLSYKKHQIFSFLRYFTKNVSIPHKKAKKKADKFHVSALKIQAFTQWKKLISLRNNFEKTAFSFQKLKNRTFLGNILSKWRFFSHFSLLKKKKFEKMSLWFIKARMLKMWKKAFEISKRFREISGKMERNYRRNLKLNALKWYFSL